MNRLTEAWFEFDGVMSTDKGLILRAMPKRPIPAERGEQITVPGRSGFLWIGENGARETIQIGADCESAAGYSPETVNTWLLGKTALLRFSDDPDYAYRARCIEAFARENKFASFDTQVFTVVFDAQPYRYVYPAPSTVTITASGGTLVNAGTVDSLPRVTVTATGEYSVTVNGCEIDVTGGSVIIDSELMDCFDADGVTPANSRVALGDFPRLSPGTNSVTWTGSVTSVAIERRSRSL